LSSYPEFNLKKLHGVFGYSFFSGLVLAIQIHTGIDISEGGLATMIYNAFRGVLGPPMPYLDLLVVGIIMLIEIVVTIVAIFQIAEHKWVGAFVSGAGFFGILSALLGSWASSQFFIIFGGVLIIAGFVVASFKE
jgi:hypothetical protein